MGKILALDIGEKRVGYAVSDETQTVAFPRGTLQRKADSELIAQIKKSQKKMPLKKL